MQRDSRSLRLVADKGKLVLRRVSDVRVQTSAGPSGATKPWPSPARGLGRGRRPYCKIGARPSLGSKSLKLQSQNRVLAPISSSGRQFDPCRETLFDCTGLLAVRTTCIKLCTMHIHRKYGLDDDLGGSSSSLPFSEDTRLRKVVHYGKRNRDEA